MARFYGMCAWLCSSLGVALLLISLVLVPQGRVFGEEEVQPPPPGGGAVCFGDNPCNRYVGGIRVCRVLTATSCTTDCSQTLPAYIAKCAVCTCDIAAGCSCQ